jgi:transcriptional regulator with XRE-family HTH domain
MKQKIEHIRKQVGILIQQVIKEKGLTRTKVAELAGITREQLAWVCRGEKDYTITTFIKILIVLELSELFIININKHFY